MSQITSLLSDPVGNAHQIVSAVSNANVTQAEWIAMIGVYSPLGRAESDSTGIASLVEEGIIPLLSANIISLAPLDTPWRDTEARTAWVWPFMLFTFAVEKHKDPYSLLRTQVEPVLAATTPLPTFEIVCAQFQVRFPILQMLQSSMSKHIILRNPPLPSATRALIIIWRHLTTEHSSSRKSEIGAAINMIVLTGLEIGQGPGAIGIDYRQFVELAGRTLDILQDEAKGPLFVLKLISSAFVSEDPVLPREIVRANLHGRMLPLLEMRRSLLHYSRGHDALRFWRQVLGHYIVSDPHSDDIEDFVNAGMIKWAIKDMLLPPPRSHIPSEYYTTIEAISHFFFRQIVVLVVHNPAIAGQARSDIREAIDECRRRRRSFGRAQRVLIESMEAFINSFNPMDPKPQVVCANTACFNTEKHDGRPLSICAKCRYNCYCSLECQKDDWKKHKKDCYTPLAFSLM